MFYSIERRGWDSNPRLRVTQRLFSRQLHSASLAPLLTGAYAEAH
jgi:hypothetical protein